MKREVRLPLTVIGVMVLMNGCVGDDSLVKQAAKAGGFATTLPDQAPDFIAQSRPSQTDFLAIGETPPPRIYKPKTAAEIEQAKAELGRTRSVNEALGVQATTLGATPPPEAALPLRP